MTGRLVALLMILLSCASAVEARTKLAALPEREAVAIRFDNPDGTLIEEERVLTLQEGVNQVDFAWRGVTLDPDSIRIAFLTHPGEVRVLSVAYPPGEPALVWRIAAGGPWEERVRISYLLSNIDRLVTYKGVASKDEKTLDLSAYLVLRNFSGEDFTSAKVDPGQGEPFETPSSHEETRQILFFSQAKVPIRKILTWDAATRPWEPKRLEGNVGIPVEYELSNDAASGLGRDILWDGKFRVFQDDGHGGTIFLGENLAEFTPVGKKLRILLGESRELQVTQVKTRDRTVNPRPSRHKVVLYDTEERIQTSIENFKEEAVTLEVVQHIPGEWVMTDATAPYEKKDNNTIVFRVEAAPKAKLEIAFDYSRKNVRR